MFTFTYAAASSATYEFAPDSHLVHFHATSVNGKWLLILQSGGKRQHDNVSFVYRSYHLPMPHPRPSTLHNFLQLGRSGSRPQRTVHPMRLPVNTDTHYFSRPRTRNLRFRSFVGWLLVPRATSSATDSPHYFCNNFDVSTALQFRIHGTDRRTRCNTYNPDSRRVGYTPASRRLTARRRTTRANVAMSAKATALITMYVK